MASDWKIVKMGMVESDDNNFSSSSDSGTSNDSDVILVISFLRPTESSARWQMESMDASLDHFWDEVMNANYLIPNDARIREF